MNSDIIDPVNKNKADEASDLETPSEISCDHLVRQWSDGSTEESKQALDELFTMLHPDLHRRAKWIVYGDRFNKSMPATAIVNELYIVMLRYEFPNIDTKERFLFLCSRKMRHIIFDYVRKHKLRVDNQASFDQVEELVLDDIHLNTNILGINSLLDKLEELDEKQAFIVTQRYLVGHTSKEIADVLKIETYQVDYQCRLGVAWLKHMLNSKK